MRLGEVIKRLAQFDIEATIFACEPWTAQSEAVVAREPEAGGLPPEAEKDGMAYFLEVGIANEIIEDWSAELQSPPTSSMICQRVIGYAINDA